MARKSKPNEICYLCGNGIEKDRLARDHVPPIAFYPKNVRAGLNLQVAPSHKECNEAYREDEEYFQHAFFVEVLNQQPPITAHLKNDFLRRAQKTQTPAMIRKILKETFNVTPGGIHLPSNKYVMTIDQARIERVVLKIIRGLFYLENKNFLPLENAKDMRLCLDENDVPDMYKHYWPAVEPSGVDPRVFSYKYFNTCKYSLSGKYPELDKFHLYSLLFWEAIMFCVTFEYPALSPEFPTSDNSHL